MNYLQVVQVIVRTPSGSIWSDRQHLAHLERVQKVTTTLLATLAYLANQKISPGDLHAAMQDATVSSPALDKLPPELGHLLELIQAE